MDDFSEFITRHADDDTSRLLLSRDKFPDIDMDLAANTIEVRRKIRKKVPSWYAVPGLIYPIKLGGEQCSSENTAMYKARTASGLFQGKFRIADLTGGLGVDSWAFSQSAETVLYNEADPALASAAERNFRTLGSVISKSAHSDSQAATMKPECRIMQVRRWIPYFPGFPRT